MTRPQEIHQFECRWQLDRDVAPIAASIQLASIQDWFERLAHSIRAPDPGPGVPAASVCYATFRNETAAVIWRYWDRNAVALDDDAERRPLVTRVLFGVNQWLNPKLAMALCYGGLPGIIGPAPGQVSVGDRLPPVDARELAELSKDVTVELDQRAGREPGLDRTIAAALNDRDTPLAIQLPERMMGGSPQGGPQGRLLWGLRQTVWPLLLIPGTGAHGERGWSFSTYEPPLGNFDPVGLANIVFRVTKEAHQAMNTRPEIIVRPREPGQRPAAPLDELAALLVEAFCRLGGGELRARLGAFADSYPSLDRRFQAVYTSLLAMNTPMSGPGRVTPLAPVDPPPASSLAPAAVTAESAVPPPETTVERPEDFAEPAVTTRAPTGADPEAASTVPAPSPRPSPRSELPRAASPSRPATAGRPEPPTPYVPPEPPLTGEDDLGGEPAQRGAHGGGPPWDTPTSGDAHADQRAVARPAGPGRHGRDQPPRQLSVLDLLDYLQDGPAERWFAEACELLLDWTDPPPAVERAAARDRMPERGWYIPVLLDDDPWDIDPILEAIFRLTVVPDLNSPAVTWELAQWALSCPTGVIRALSAAAAHQQAGQAEGHMAEALAPALAKRWLTEHGIYAYAVLPEDIQIVSPAVRGVPARPAAPERAALTRWDVFVGRPLGEVIAAILAVLCALLIVSLTVTIVRG